MTPSALEQFDEKTIQKAAEIGACLQRIQMKVWEYMALPKEKRNGVNLADDIFRDVEQVVKASLLQEIEGMKKKKDVCETCKGDHSGDLEIIGYNQAIEDVKKIIKKK